MTQQFSHKLYIGCTTNEGKDLNILDVKRFICKTMCNYNIPYYTLFDAVGCYQETNEKTIVVEVLSDSIELKSLAELATELKLVLEQDCIGYSVTSVNFSFL